MRLYTEELERYEAIEKAIAGNTDLRYPYATLRLGIAWVKACLVFWTDIAEHRPD